MRVNVDDLQKKMTLKILEKNHFIDSFGNYISINNVSNHLDYQLVNDCCPKLNRKKNRKEAHIIWI